MTRLANYRHLRMLIWDQASRAHGAEFALLLFDVDGLKQINDRYGHLIGSHATLPGGRR